MLKRFFKPVRRNSYGNHSTIVMRCCRSRSLWHALSFSRNRFSILSPYWTWLISQCTPWVGIKSGGLYNTPLRFHKITILSSWDSLLSWMLHTCSLQFGQWWKHGLMRRLEKRYRSKEVTISIQCVNMSIRTNSQLGWVESARSHLRMTSGPGTILRSSMEWSQRMLSESNRLALASSFLLMRCLLIQTTL